MSVDLDREHESRDQIIRQNIAVAAAGAHYELADPNLSAKQRDIVEGWFQFPMNVQTIAVLGLIFAGVTWWAAILLAWIPSTALALATRSSKSSAIGQVGHLSRWAAQIVCAAFAINALMVGQWIMLALPIAGFFGLLGMLSPAMFLMSAGPDRWHPKYSYASRAFGIEFPFQLASRRLGELASEPLSEERKQYLKSKYLQS